MPAPVPEKQRIVSLDVLRGVALLGILPMNIQYFSMPGAAYWNPTAYGDLHGANYLVWFLSHLFADLKFMAVFSMLFGAGIVLMTSRVESAGRRPAPVHYRRMGCLILFGLLHAHLLWAGDILYDYGVCGLVVYFFRKLAPRALIVLGLLTVSITSAIMFVSGYSLSHAPAAVQQQWREELWQPTPEGAAQELHTARGAYLQQLRARVSESLALETVYFVRWSFWREAGLMLIGMAFFKTGVLSAKRSPRFYAAMIAMALCAGVPVIWYGVVRQWAHAWSFPDGFFYGLQYNYWASLLVSGGWIGAAMLASRAPALLPLTRRLAAVGRMAFTNYILHTLICTTIFYGYGFGLFGHLERIRQFAIVAAIWFLQLWLSPFWLRHFQFGPLEWLWRSATYLQREPFRRSIPNEVPLPSV